MEFVTPKRPKRSDTEIDRLLELVSIGAGHAAGALATLVGETCWMTVPMVSPAGELPPGSLFADARSEPLRDPASGIFFEVRGALRGSMAVLLPGDARARILRGMLGGPAAFEDQEHRVSALQELGNILVSHVVSAMADTLGETILPSIPTLALRDAVGVLSSLVTVRETDGTNLRLETVIADRDGEAWAVLVFLPVF